MAISAFTLATRLHAGETVFSGWCGLPYPLVAETLARDGFANLHREVQYGRDTFKNRFCGSQGRSPCAGPNLDL